MSFTLTDTGFIGAAIFADSLASSWKLGASKLPIFVKHPTFWGQLHDLSPCGARWTTGS